jgi:hypothetical protein
MTDHYKIYYPYPRLYSETGWTTLSSRRHNRKLQLLTERLKILKRYFEVVVQKTDKYNSRKKKALKDKE